VTRTRENAYLAGAELPFDQRMRNVNYDDFSRILQPTVPLPALSWEYRYGKRSVAGAGATATWLSEIPPAGFQDVYYNISSGKSLTSDAWLLGKLLANGPATPFRSELSRFTTGASVIANMIGNGNDFTNVSTFRTSAPVFVNENEQLIMNTFSAIAVGETWDIIWECYRRPGPRTRGEDVSALATII